MKINMYKLLNLLFVILLLLAGCKDPVIEDPDDDWDGPKWVLNEEKTDEFNQWDTNKWGTSLWYSTTSSFAFNSANVSVSDGYLRLTAKKESYNGKNYTCGAVKSKFTLGNNSYIEIRAKTIDYRANVTTALWLSDVPGADKNPNVEIDIMETLSALSNPKKFTATIHYWWVGGIGDQALEWKDYFLTTTNMSDNFHTYKLERTDGKIRLFFDGIMFWNFSTVSHTPVSQQERNVIFSIEGHAGAPVDAFLPGEFLIDYIRVYDYITSPK